mmetsp:Transcript_27915/g.46405  ORF Transcript_27915/g.46405 Transcript_27915/m.46405 type:complete len:226 (-) Transcript_27915:74-751(-)
MWLPARPLTVAGVRWWGRSTRSSSSWSVYSFKELGAPRGAAKRTCSSPVFGPSSQGESESSGHASMKPRSLPKPVWAWNGAGHSMLGKYARMVLSSWPRGTASLARRYCTRSERIWLTEVRGTRCSLVGEAASAADVPAAADVLAGASEETEDSASGSIVCAGLATAADRTAAAGDPVAAVDPDSAAFADNVADSISAACHIVAACSGNVLFVGRPQEVSPVAAV